MNRDTFSHIRLWCPRPFGTYSQNKPYSNGTICNGTTTTLCKADDSGLTTIETHGVTEEQDEDVGTENTPPDAASTLLAPPLPASPSPNSQMEDGRVLLDTWYVIKPGNTKEKIAFFVAHQCNGAGIPRPSAMKVKGNWATDCTKAKRRRRCSSYEPPTRAQNVVVDVPTESSSTEDGVGVSETDLLSVAEMVALVEQRTALALQGMVAQGQTSPYTVHQKPVVILSEPPSSAPTSQSDFDLLQQQQESRRVAQAVAQFESRQQNLDSTTLRPELSGRDRIHTGDSVGGTSSHGRGEVRIAFRVSSLDPRTQSEPVGRPKCMFMSCGVGGGQAGTRSKEKITCDLYQLVSPSSRDPGALLAGSPKADPLGEGITDRPSSTTPDPNQDPASGEKAAVARERVTGFHVEVVVTGAVDQCVFYGKDSTENVQEETVCFAMPNGANSTDASEDPPPGQLFFLQSPATEDESCSAVNSGMRSLDCANNNGPVGATVERPDSPLANVDDCSDPPFCRLYRHVSHDFLEIRCQIQRLLEPRQYMLSLPDHIMVNIFSYLPTRSLAALKCTCHDFKTLIETYGVRATDSRWNQDPLYRDDPCKQCKRQYERGDVSLCRWHPKPYHHDLPYGRSYWMCCRRTDKDTPGCRVGLHDNNWVQPCELVQARAKRDDGR
ncbi:F-box only protein 46 [Puntigrus tetrazona]|uniref:F-box only protein 46 n=1 Tax=Puntigrus tetrazona TaxID=1606681 RepID=UPI001C89B943|nr:F-box only protein 46 [Puntigrus tetrazona]